MHPEHFGLNGRMIQGLHNDWLPGTHVAECFALGCVPSLAGEVQQDPYFEAGENIFSRIKCETVSASRHTHHQCSPQ